MNTQQPKLVIGLDGAKQWLLNNKYHREDGPAIEGHNNYKEWRINGKLHREDGPAIEGYNGGKFWYLNGHLISSDKFTNSSDFTQQCADFQKFTIIYLIHHS